MKKQKANDDYNDFGSRKVKLQQHFKFMTDNETENYSESDKRKLKKKNFTNLIKDNTKKETQ